MECYTIYGTKYLDSYNWSILEAFFHWARADIVARAGTQKTLVPKWKGQPIAKYKIVESYTYTQTNKNKKTKEKEKEKGAIHD